MQRKANIPGYPNMQEFFDPAAQSISAPELLEIMQAIQGLREK